MKININESRLARVISESVIKLLNENYFSNADNDYSPEDFLSMYREIENRYRDDEEEIFQFYRHLLEEWENDLDDEYKSQYPGGFKDYCESIVADMLGEKYNGLNK